MVYWAFPAITATISGIFGAFMLMRFSKAHKRHQLLWALGLFGITAAALSQTVEASLGYWPDGVYRVYYWLVGTMVATMGAGTIYLMGKQKVADYFLYAVIGLVAIQAAVCAFAAVDQTLLVPPGVDSGVRAASAPMRAMTGILNIAGAGALLVGAFVSWYATKRLHNLAIVVGMVLFTIGGSIAGVDASGSAGQWGLYLGNLSGIVALFLGFLLSRAANENKQAAATVAPTTA